jgi:hypothetical protein
MSNAKNSFLGWLIFSCIVFTLIVASNRRKFIGIIDHLTHAHVDDDRAHEALVKENENDRDIRMEQERRAGVEKDRTDFYNKLREIREAADRDCGYSERIGTCPDGPDRDN